MSVDRSDIFGVVGYSGAGKSTLIRCVNLLEKPDSGKVLIEGREITGLSESQLEQTRQKIGMIFQHFNLLRSKTVFENIAFPLRYLHKSKIEIEEKVTALLDLVDLRDKSRSYPAQLSGGQKQRVAIARALANDPKILLSDEATSALDPQTTDSILQLLLKLNQQLNLTIMIITHEMQVVKEICNKIAIMEDGRIIEKGDTFNIFSQPQADITKRFSASLFKSDSIQKILSQVNLEQITHQNGKLLHLVFIGENANDAHIANVIRRFDVSISIIYGSIEVVQAKPIGSLFVAVNGSESQILGAISHLKTQGVSVSALERDAGSYKEVTL